MQIYFPESNFNLKRIGINERTESLYEYISKFSWLKKHIFNKKRKHIETHYHFICELVSNGNISLQFFGSRDQLIDIFTKPWGKTVFYFQRQHLSIISTDVCNHWVYEGVLTINSNFLMIVHCQLFWTIVPIFLIIPFLFLVC
jgi:hypothetical protein